MDAIIAPDAWSDPEATARTRIRGEIYAALALIFRQPSDEMDYDGLACLLEDALRCLPEANSREPGYLDELQYWRHHTEPQERLEAEYFTLFYAPGKAVVPPYESIYTSAPRQMMGPAALDAMTAYQEAGFGLKPTYHDCPDHLATELEFMAHLCIQEASAGDRREPAAPCRRQQHHFLQHHLARWIPAFASRLRGQATTAFWRLVADIVEAFVSAEMDRGRQPGG